MRLLACVWIAVMLPALVGGCGRDDGPTEPSLPKIPDTQFLNIVLYACPEDTSDPDRCLQDVDIGGPLEADRWYVQRLLFTNADFLLGKLTWPPHSETSGCQIQESTAECVMTGLWGPYDLLEGVQDITFRFAVASSFRIHWLLILEDSVAADTTLVFDVRDGG